MSPPKTRPSPAANVSPAGLTRAVFGHPGFFRKLAHTLSTAGFLPSHIERIVSRLHWTLTATRCSRCGKRLFSSGSTTSKGRPQLARFVIMPSENTVRTPTGHIITWQYFLSHSNRCVRSALRGKKPSAIPKAALLTARRHGILLTTPRKNSIKLSARNVDMLSNLNSEAAREILRSDMTLLDYWCASIVLALESDSSKSAAIFRERLGLTEKSIQYLRMCLIRHAKNSEYLSYTVNVLEQTLTTSNISE